MDRLSLKIGGKILLLNGFILLMMAGALLYNYFALGKAISAIEFQKQALSNQQSAVATSRAYSELRYWMVDLALSWQNESETNATTSQEELEKLFKQLEGTNAELVQAIRPQVELFSKSMMESVDAYIDENRVLGNSLVADGRKNSVFIDAKLNELLSATQANANAEGDKVVATNGEIRSYSLILLVVATIIGIFLSYFFARSITRPLQAVVVSLGDMANGNLEQEELLVKSSDEIGSLSTSFNGLLASVKGFLKHADALLKGRIPASDKFGLQGEFEQNLKGMYNQAIEKQKADAETSRISQIVESMTNNILYADVDFKIQYANPASIRTLKQLEHLLPIKADQILGQSIDAFHKNPAHQRNFLADSKNLPHQTQIQLGDEILDLNVAAINDQNGELLGYMAGWAVVTELVQNERNSKEAGEREQKQAEELRTKVDSMLEVVSSAVDGDLTQEVTVKGTDAIGQMGEGLAEFLQKMRTNMQAIGHNAETLASASEELTATSQQMAGNAEETSAQSGVVSAASDEVSKNVETVATGAEEMSASIKEIAQNANEAARVATEAVTVAETTNTTISKLGESSNEIGQVIKVITSIAEQTNLLALNATIEAARAGEAGKGFAVVANEVKDLANQTAKATEEISGKIGAIQSDTKSSVDAIAEISEVINKINDISNTIASAVEEQTATTAEIGRNVGEAAKGTAEIAQNISGVSQAAQSTTQGASDTQGASSELSKMAAELQGLVGQFKV
jgi:methyl-accepting chemotaxis protein